MWLDRPDGNAYAEPDADWHEQCAKNILASHPSPTLTVCQARCEAGLLQKAYGSTLTGKEAAMLYIHADTQP